MPTRPAQLPILELQTRLEMHWRAEDCLRWQCAHAAGTREGEKKDWAGRTATNGHPTVQDTKAQTEEERTGEEGQGEEKQEKEPSGP